MTLAKRNLGGLEVSAQGLGCMSMSNFPYGPFDEDEQELRRSTRKLVDMAAREQALSVVAHDAEQWPTLRHSPEYYD